jgi:hypothetical protein
MLSIITNRHAKLATRYPSIAERSSPDVHQSRCMLQCYESTVECSKWHVERRVVQWRWQWCLLKPNNPPATGFHFFMPENGMKSTPQLTSSSIMHPSYYTNYIVFARTMSAMIPSNFSSGYLRNRVPYRNLSAVELTAKEKTFLANEAPRITKFLTWDTEEFSIVWRICNRYHIPFSSMKGWKERIEKRENNKGQRRSSTIAGCRSWYPVRCNFEGAPSIQRCCTYC